MGIRPRICLLSALSGALGCMLAASGGAMDAVACFVGIFLLAAGASLLNQVLEVRTDSLMHRTMLRPLVTGAMSRSGAITASAALSGAGLWALALTGPTAPALGVLAFILYNFAYTPLKKHTPFCLLAGAAAGALPPLMGWAGGGGQLGSAGALSLFGFFYLWQVPHFMLISLQRADDYRRAGIPVLTDQLNPAQVTRVACAWMLSGVLAALMLASPSRGFYH